MDRRSPVLSAVRRALDAPGGPDPAAHLLIACSGGPDSTALLLTLAELADEHRRRLSTAYLDHGLRGAETRREAEFVAELARVNRIAYVEREIRVGAGPNLEARARRARYRALGAIAREMGATDIVTAHTQDDQAETVLLRLLRGAGRRGLGGMRVRAGRLWRPLLGVTRVDVRAYLAQRGATFMVDRTNADLRFRRNRVRRLLVPFLEAEFNARLGPALAAMAARLRDEDVLLTDIAGERGATLIDGPRLATAVRAAPRALGRRIVLTWLRGAAGRTPSATHVERVLDLAAETHGTVGLPGPRRVVCEPPWLVLRDGHEGTARPFRLEVAPGTMVEHPDGHWRLECAPVEPRAATALSGAGPAVAVFDADQLPARLAVRGPAPGDRIHVPNVGTRKVHDVLIDARVPREARPTVPLVTAGDAVLWVAGIVRGSLARVSPTTRRVVRLVLHSSALPPT